jgi:hypothetical protein
MTRKKTSPVWTNSKDQIQKLLNESSSFVEVLEKLNLCSHSGNHRTLKLRIKEDSLNIDILKENRNKIIKSTAFKEKIPLAEIMVQNSKYYNSTGLKKRLIKENILKYACAKCGNDGNWMGTKLVLQLEHKNGNSRDHRLENLSLLCPNCHSQTETYAGKNSSNKKNSTCIECNTPTKGKGKRCRRCVSNKQSQKFFVEKKELERLVKIFPMTTLGKKFGVSDNAVRKRCKKLGIKIPKKKSG